MILLELYWTFLSIKSNLTYKRHDDEHMSRFNPDVPQFKYDVMILFLKISNES